MSEVFIGIDLGGTNIKIGCFDSNLKLIRKISVPTDVEMGPEAVIDKMAQTIKKLLADVKLSLKDVPAIGLGTPGPAKYKEGILLAMANFPKFKNVPICRMLSEKLGKPIIFDNDANVACWGEFSAGAAKDVKDMVFFTLGTGIGGAIISEGKLLQGCDGNGAELGHIIIYPDGRLCGCGQKGCAEAYASASTTTKRAVEAIQAGRDSTLKKLLDEKGELTCQDVYQHSRAGDNLAKEITDETAKVLAILSINMLHATEPEKIVFAGGMINEGDFLLDRIKYFFGKYIWTLKSEPVEICFATLGGDAGITGAAALSRYTFKTKK